MSVINGVANLTLSRVQEMDGISELVYVQNRHKPITVAITLAPIEDAARPQRLKPCPRIPNWHE